MYQAKTLFRGYKIGVQNPDWYVAIPTKKLKGGKCKVKYGNDARWLKSEDIETKRVFKDKFGRGDYTLNYIKWKKDV